VFALSCVDHLGSFNSGSHFAETQSQLY